MLTEVAESVSQIRLPQTRVRAQLLVSQLLSLSDEKLAAKVAAEAAESVKQYVANADASEQDYYQTYELAMQLRQEVAQVLASRSGSRAGVLRSTQTLSNPSAQNRWERELHLEVSLANQLAAKDPQRAMQVAEESLKKGYSSGLLEVVNRLRLTEPEMAAKLAKQMAAKLRDEKLLKNQEATNLALGLLRMNNSPVRRFQSRPQRFIASENRCQAFI